jgi:hypothetical protein
VRRYIERGLQPPTYGPRKPRPRLLDPFTGFLRERVTAYPGLTGGRLLHLNPIDPLVGTLMAFVRELGPCSLRSST